MNSFEKGWNFKLYVDMTDEEKAEIDRQEDARERYKERFADDIDNDDDSCPACGAEPHEPCSDCKGGK